jgi:hypothetical protein
LKRHALGIGLDPHRVSGHSLRRGGTTAYFLAGVPETVIGLHGRWRSHAYRVYFADTTPQFLASSYLNSHTSGRYPALPHQRPHSCPSHRRR